MKKQSPKKNDKKRKLKPAFKWQTGSYAILQNIQLHLPYAFLLLCKLWGITPREVIIDFMDNLASGSWKREGRELAKTHIKNYIAAMRYGQDHYTPADIDQMFVTLEAIGSLWPQNANMKMIERHARWRSKYYNWWFKKTWNKYKRKPLQQNTDSIS